MDIIGKKYWYFLISTVIIVPGIISLLLFGLKLSIDFTGGSRQELQIASVQQVQDKNSKLQTSNEKIKETVEKQKVEVSSIQKSGDNVYIIRTKPIDEKKHQEIKNALIKEFPKSKELSFQTIGPTIGSETTLNALKAVLIASILIVFYIAWSFRKVPKPASSFRFGICAVAALVHDILLLVGVFSILGHFFNVEVDALFITAVLTVMGFSVHDTIVVFDRIRENLRRMAGAPFASIVNESIIQTLGRSLNTSLTVLLVLFTLLIFGGESMKWFIVALLIGIASGTYSSIFNASALLEVWEERARRKGLRRT